MECILWEDHPSELVSFVSKLYQNAELMDCVLDTDGVLVKAHRVILAACSPYFKNLLVDYNSMVTIPLKEIKYRDMKHILDFMYYGKVNVPVLGVSSFMKTVKFFQMASLTRFDSNFTDNFSCTKACETLFVRHRSTLRGVNHLKCGGEDITEQGTAGVSEQEDGFCANCKNTDLQTISSVISKANYVTKLLSGVRNNLEASILKSTKIEKDIMDEDGENLEDYLNPISFVAVSPFSEKVEDDDQSVMCPGAVLKNPLEEYSYDCDLTKERIVKRENDLKTEPRMQRGYEEEMNVCVLPIQNMDNMSISQAQKNNSGSDNISFGGGVKVLCDELSASIVEKSLIATKCTNGIQINQNVTSDKMISTGCSKDSFVERSTNLEVKFEAVCGISGIDIKEEKLCECLTSENTIESNKETFIEKEHREKELPNDSTIVDDRKEMTDVITSLTPARIKLMEAAIVSQRINSTQVQDSNENSDETHESAFTHMKLCEERRELKERTGSNSSRIPNFNTKKQCNSQHLVPRDSFHLDPLETRGGHGLTGKVQTHSSKRKNYSCVNCRKSFSRVCHLNIHMRTHTGEKLFQCKICEKSFIQKVHLKAHKQTHTGKKRFNCEICKSSFRKAGTLKNHIRTHTGEKPFQCEICKKLFSRNDSLKIHIRTHTGEKTFQCEICKKSFSRKGHLTGHMRTHTRETPLHCEISKFSFNYNGAFKNHMRIHTGEKPFQCEMCKKSFTSKGILLGHIRTHSGEKPFHCQICKTSFPKACTLKNHIRTHTGEKPFKCEICKKSFTLKGNLIVHMRIHTGEKQFQCEICKKSFRHHNTLCNHMQTHTG